MTNGGVVTNGEVVKLREYLEGLIRHEREMREGHQREAKEALKIQAEVYESRLRNLNNEAARIQAVVTATVTRELFDSHRAFEDARCAQIVQSLSEMRGEARGAASRQTTLMAAVGLTVTVLAFLMRLLPI